MTMSLLAQNGIGLRASACEIATNLYCVDGLGNELEVS
jgi:hypothetical protein